MIAQTQSEIQMVLGTQATQYQHVECVGDESAPRQSRERNAWIATVSLLYRASLAEGAIRKQLISDSVTTDDFGLKLFRGARGAPAIFVLVKGV